MDARVARLQARALPVVAVVTGAAWIAAAVLMSGRGLDLTDESFYLLSYRWWDSNPNTFTGVQYLFGPLYEALGYDAQLLRLVRLGLVLATHAVLGFSAATWIHATASSSEGSHASRLAVVLPVVSAGGIIFAWGPLSPGYNDVGLLASVLLAAGVLTVHASVSKSGSMPWTVAAGLGPVVVAMALAKWSSAIVAVPFVLCAMTLAVMPQRPRGGVRWILVLLVSTSLTVGMVHALIKPLPDIVGPIVTVTGRLSAGSNAPADLLLLYATTTTRVVLLALVPVALVALVLAVTSRVAPHSRRPMAGAAPVATLVLAVALSGGLSGGVSGIAGYVTVLLAVVATVWLVSRLDREAQARSPGSRAVVAMLVLLPGVQALGTGNALFILAVNGFALWMVLLLRAWSHGKPAGMTRMAATSAIAGSLVAIGWVAVTGVLVEPYRTASFSASSDSFQSPSIGELQLDAETAAGFRQLQASAPSGLPTMAFDEMAGLVLVLDGRPVGEAWYSAIDRARTAAGIVSYCAERDEPWRSGLPVVAFNRRVSSVELEALHRCGLSLDTDYTRLRLPTTIGQLTLYLPREVE